MIDISGHLRNYRQDCGFSDSKNYILVNSCGYQKFITRNSTTFREKGRLDYQLLYVCKGSGRFKCKQEMVEVPKDHLILYRPGEEQHYAYGFESSPEVYWIHFTGYGAGDCLEKAGLSGKQIISLEPGSLYETLLKKIILELQLKQPLFECTVNAYFLELLALMGRNHIKDAVPVRKQPGTNLTRVLESMHTQYHKNWSIADFARQCSLSSYRFLHVFRTAMQMSPVEYLTRVRIDKAKDLLLSSSLNIHEIANVVGYGNPLYFSRIFKKLEGVPPRAFRQTPDCIRKM